MRPTLFPIPDRLPTELGGFSVFGFGVLLVGWLLFSLVFVAWLVRRQGFNADTRSYLPVMAIVAAAIALLLPRLVQPGEGLPIRGYGVMMLVGVVTGVGLAAWRAERRGMSVDVIFSLAFWMFLAGITGARLFHVIEYWGDLYRQPKNGPLDLFATFKEVINVPRGGLVVYGSLIAGLVVLVWFVRRRGLPGFALADLIAPSMLLGLAFGRIGCLMNGCCFGGVCDLPWGIYFPQDSLPYEQQVERGLNYGIQVGGRRDAMPPDGAPQPGAQRSRWQDDGRLSPVIEWVRPDVGGQGLKADRRIIQFGELKHPTAPQVWRLMHERAKSGGAIGIVTTDDPIERHLQWSPPPTSLAVQPTQIYSAFNALLLCLFLLAYHPFRRRDGEVFGLLITLYPVTRFLLEIIRTDEAAMFGTHLSISQLVSVMLLLGVVIYWIYVLRQPAGRLWTAEVPAPEANRPPQGRRRPQRGIR